MKCSSKISPVLVFLVVQSLNSAAVGQGYDTEKVWADIKNSGSRLSKINIKWETEFIGMPNAELDIDKVAASAEMQARAQGLNEQQVKNQVASQTKIAKLTRDGFTQRGSLSYLSDGNRARCERSVELPDDSRTISNFINYYDENVTVNISQANKPESPGKWVGRVVPSLSNKLEDTAVGFMDPYLLLGSPLAKCIEFKDITWRQCEAGYVLRFPLPENPDKVDVEIMVSSRHCRPLQVKYLAKTGCVQTVYKLEKYKEYSCGVWFPELITRQDFNKQEKLKAQMVYRLLECNLGNHADLSALKEPFPVGAILKDERYGKIMPIPYELKKTSLPTEDELKSMANKL